MESKKVVQHVYLVGAKSIYRVAEKDKEYLRDEEEKNQNTALALPEYMMAGKPIVASRVDAIPNIIRNGENGLLVEVDDATGASEAVLQIYRDRSLKDKLVSKGVEDVHNRFDAQRVSEEHGILFENMWKVETI